MSRIVKAYQLTYLYSLLQVSGILHQFGGKKWKGEAHKWSFNLLNFLILSLPWDKTKQCSLSNDDWTFLTFSSWTFADSSTYKSYKLCCKGFLKQQTNDNRNKIVQTDLLRWQWFSFPLSLTFIYVSLSSHFHLPHGQHISKAFSLAWEFGLNLL